jgi:hypothetical protein
MPGILDALFAGPEAGLLTPEQRQLAGKQALRDFGLSLIMSGAPPGGGKNAPPFLAALAAGTKAGEQSYANYAQRERQAQTTGRIEDILAGGLTPMSAGAAFGEAVAGRDLETARTLGPLLQSYVSAGRGTGKADMKLEDKTNPLTGEREWWAVPTAPGPGQVPQLVMTQETEGDVLPPGLQESQRAVLSRFASASSDVRDVANSYRRVLSATNTLLKAEEEMAEASASGREYVRPTAAAMAAISSFARLLDPGSVVREGEFHIVSNQGSLVDRIRRWWEQIMSGMVPKGLANALQNEAYRQTQAQHSTFKELASQARAEAKSVGISRDSWLPIYDPFESALQEHREGTIEDFDPEWWLQQGQDSTRQDRPLTAEEIDSIAAGGR